MKGLLIKSCSDSLRWYSNSIGKLVPLVDTEGDHFEYRSVDNDGYINFVLKSDAEIVEVEEAVGDLG